MQAIPTRPSCQLNERPRMEPMIKVETLCTIAPRVIPARPLIFCGLSLSVDVRLPVLFSSLSKNSMSWRRMARKESERSFDVSSAAAAEKR